MDTVKINSGKTKMVAHRGVSGLECENTCAAFVAAGNRSYFGIETDVHYTADGKFAIIHDDNTGRVSDMTLSVEESTWDELKVLPLHDKAADRTRGDLRIPQLFEYIRICKRYEKTAVLELKRAMSDEAIAGIVKTIEDEGYFEGTIFISFTWHNLEVVRSLRPDAAVQFLTTKCDDELTAKLIENSFDLDLLYQAATKELIDALHAAGRLINVWTVDDPAAAETLVGWGVDFITSNILE